MIGTGTKPVRLVDVHGEPGNPLVISGGSITIPPDQKQSALWIKGCSNLVIDGLTVIGGWDCISLFECDRVTIRNANVSGSTNDGIKAANSTRITVEDSQITGGQDQGVDYFHVIGGAIRRNVIRGGVCGIFCKAGSTRIRVVRNDIACDQDGIHFGDYGDPAKMPPGPWAVDCHAERNVIRVGGRPIAMINASGCTERNNDMETTRMVGKEPGPLVVHVTR